MLLFRVVRFRRGDAHQFQTAEGEHNDRHHHHQPGESRAAGNRPDPTGYVTVACGPPLPLNNSQAPNRIMATTATTLIIANQNSISPNTFTLVRLMALMAMKKTAARGPGRDFRPPELDIFAHGGQFRHGDKDIQHPIVPAGGKAGKAAPVFISKMAE